MAIEDSGWPTAHEWLRQGDAEGCDISLYGVPTSIGSVFPSHAHKAPNAFREELSRSSPFHSGEGVDLQRLRAVDGGDFDLPTGNLEETLTAIAEITHASFLGTTAAVFVGGDNSITRPVLKGTSATEWSEGYGLLSFDARHDVSTLSAGPTNETPVRGLIEDGLPGERISQIGIHSFANSAEHRDFCEAHNVGIRTMQDVDARGVEEVVNHELHRLSGRSDWIFVDFDMGVLDMAYAPGCAAARPGGMTPRQLARAAFLCGQHPKVIAADLVEVDPDRDLNGVTIANMVNTFLSFCAGIAARRVIV